jgi:hypothetical protein
MAPLLGFAAHESFSPESRSKGNTSADSVPTSLMRLVLDLTEQDPVRAHSDARRNNRQYLYRKRWAGRPKAANGGKAIGKRSPPWQKDRQHALAAVRTQGPVSRSQPGEVLRLFAVVVSLPGWLESYPLLIEPGPQLPHLAAIEHWHAPCNDAN